MVRSPGFHLFASPLLRLLRRHPMLGARMGIDSSCIFTDMTTDATAVERTSRIQELLLGGFQMCFQAVSAIEGRIARSTMRVDDRRRGEDGDSVEGGIARR